MKLKVGDQITVRFLGDLKYTATIQSGTVESITKHAENDRTVVRYRTANALTWCYLNDVLTVNGKPANGTPPPLVSSQEPQHCPFCGGMNIYLFMVEWQAVSQEDGNVNMLQEHQCLDCAGKSFWT